MCALLQVSAACERAADECEALWKQHQQFLSIPSQPALEDAFVAMVADHYNNLKVASETNKHPLQALISH